ncbi:ABC transporter ATP-binding protein, partial [Ruminococcus sp. RTP21484sp1_RTP31003st1_F6_RTP31003_210430]
AIGFEGILTCTIAMMGSFGPVVALSSLSNNLNQTLASGERVLSLLEETPLVEEIPGDVETPGTESVEHEFTGAEAENVTFAYDNEVILDNYSLKMQTGKITGIHGASGSGKSTLLKLLMRFWDVQDGSVSVDGTDVRKIPIRYLRDMESYVTQETHLFHDSIANNIEIAKPGASREEIMEAAKKASIHDFIMTLPKEYDTEVGELGDTLSGGEKQRIGIARAFLHECPLILLDEPTSNLDSLNEGIILKSLKESARKKTVVLVSHRVSTMNVADVVYEMENGRIS